MSSTGSLPELDALRSQVADLSRQLAERDRSSQHQREQSDLLRAIVEGTAAETGDAFFSALVAHLTSVLHVKYAFIGEVQGDHIKKIRTLAVSAGGAIVDNFEYALAHTPCASALTQSVACFDRGLQTMFPQFTRLADLGAESYCAVPLRTKGGAVIGLLVVMDTKPLQQGDDLRSLLEVFAPRIAAEFERRRAEQERAQALADLHNVIETIPDIVFALDTQGNVLKWNRRLGDVTGYSSEELLNKPALAFVPPEEQARTAAAIQRVFMEGYAELEGHLMTKEHHLIPYHWAGALLKNSHGEPVGITGIGRDVSEKKRAEEALRRSEERFALAVEGSNDILWDAHRLPGEPWYAPQTPIWWSPRVRQLLGLQESDSFETFEQWAARLHPDDKDRVFGQLTAHIEHRVPYDVEYRLRTNRGDYRWIRGRGQALWDEQGEPRRMSGSCQDITGRKRTEELLRISEERFRSILQHEPECVKTVAPDGTLLMMNPSGLSMIGARGEEEVINQSVLPLIYPEDRAAFQRLHQAVCNGASDALQFRIKTLQGEVRWMDTQSVPLREGEGEGEVTAVLSITRDITKRKRAEEELQEMNVALANAMPGIAHLDPDGRYCSINEVYAGALGYDPSELIGGDWSRTIHPDDRPKAEAAYATMLREGKGEFEALALRKDGSTFRKQALMVKIADPEGRYLGHHCFMRDITERKQAQDALAQSERQLRTVLDALPAGVWFTDRSGKPLFGNPAAKEIWSNTKQIGLQASDNQSSWWETIGPANEPHRRALSHVLTTGVPSLGETFELDCLDGTKKTIRNSTLPVQSEAGVTLGAIVLNEDITLLRQAQAALQLTQFSVDHAVEGFFWIGPDARIVYVNEAACRMLEYTRDELTAMTVHDIDPNFPPEVWQAHWKELREKGSLTFESKHWSRTGRVLETEVTVNYLRYEGSEYGCAIMRDIGARKRADAALRASEERYWSLYDETPTMYFTLATDGTVLSVSRFGAEQLGYRVEELIGHSVLGLFHEQDKDTVAASLAECLATPEITRHWEFRKRRKDGSVMWVRESARVDQSSTGDPVVLVTCEDVTERRVNEQLLAAEKRILEVISTDVPLQEVLTLMCQQFEELSNSARYSILLLDPDGLHLRHGAAPSLPQSYVHAIDGMAIGPAAGSCGTAAFLRRQVIVSDIACDPLWADFRDLALGHGLQACWSTPVISSDGAVLGTFAVYYGEPQQPSHADLRLVERVARIACIAIERKQTEEALRKSEERYARATAVGKVGVWELDVATGTYHGDPNLKALFGYADDELSTDPFVWLNLVHPDDQSIAMDHWQRIVNGEMDDSNYELRMLKKDGTVIWTDVRGHAVRDPEGQVTQLFGATVDISERKQVQDALAQSEHQLRTVLDSLPVGVWFTDRLGRPLLANPMAKRILSNIKQIGLQNLDNAVSWWETVEPATDPHRWALSHALRTGAPSLNEILELECLDGTKKTIRNSTVPVKNESGNIMGAVVLNEDITLLRVAQEALELTKFSVDCAVEGFFWIGPDARILNVNEAACRILEYTREELTAMTVYDIDPNVPPEVWLTHWEELKEAGSLIFESKYWSRTGRVLNTEVTVNYLRYEGSEYGCAIMRDIEPRKRADVALRASEERYRALYDDTPTMYFTLAMDGTVRSVNRFGAKQLGYRVEELIGHSVLGLFHEQDKEAVAASLSECLATPAITRYWEFRKVGKDGNIIWVRETVRVDQSSAEEPIVLVTCEDITEHKRAEDESRERILQASAMQTALLKLAHLDDTSLTFSIILPQVTSIVADMLVVERVSLWLLSEDQTELVCQDLYLRGQAAHSAGSRLTALSYPRYLAVLKESLVIAASHARVDQRTSEFADDYFSSLGITSVLDVPICRQGKLVGVLWCEHVGAAREWAHEAQDFAASVGQTIVRMIEAAERKRAEMSLRQSEERYRSLLDNAPIGIFVNKAGRFAYANREIQRILNATRAEQLLGMPVLDRIAPEFHTVVKDRIPQLMEKGQPVPSSDEQYVRLDGSRIDVAVTAIPTSFDGTDVIQVLVLDIAERKQAEQEQNRLIEDLIRSRQHFQALFNWTPSAVGISTVAEGRFIDVNEGFSRLTGYMREEVMGRTTLELGLWADVSERESVLREIREQGYLHNREGLLRTKSGEIRSLMVSVESIQLGSTPCLICLCHDITERKRMEDALRMRERELQAALQERERISQDLHDGILQSLFAVGLNLEVAKSFMPPRTRKTSGASLDKAIDQLNRVLREIRNFIARLDLDLFEGKDLPTALRRALKSLTENQATRVRLEVEDRAANAVSVEQSLHLFHVIQEAVSNCIRHGGAQEARVSLKMLKQGVRLSIRDNGRGFNPNVAKGVGHGLANMAARAKKIGGRFTVLSKENEGTRIVLDLPKEASNVSR